MKNILLSSAILLISISSCTTMYKSGQTPDDVYYSPVRTYAEPVVKEEPRQTQQNRVESWEDRQIRMSINNPRWRYLDNAFDYNPYSYSNYDYFNYGNSYLYNPYNTFNSYGSFYNPYIFGHNYCNYYNPYISYPVTVATINKNSTPRMSNLGTYNSGFNNNNIGTLGTTKYGGVKPVRSYNNSNGSRVGNTLNRVLNAGNQPAYQSPQTQSSTSGNRTYTPAPSSSGSSSSSPSSSSSSGTGVSRPSR